VCCPECGAFADVGSLSGFPAIWGRRLVFVAVGLWLLALLGGLLLPVLLQASVTSVMFGEVTVYDYPHRIAASIDHGLVSMLTFQAAIVALMGYLFVCLVTAIIPHWRWQSYLMLVCAWLLAGTAFPIALWYVDSPPLLSWLLCTAGWMLGGELVVAVGAIFTGRRFTRRLVTLLIPPKLRPTFAYLWLIDGLEPPKATATVPPAARPDAIEPS